MCLICAIIFILSIPTIILPILCLIIYGFSWYIYKRCPQEKDDACLLKNARLGSAIMDGFVIIFAIIVWFMDKNECEKNTRLVLVIVPWRMR